MLHLKGDIIILCKQIIIMCTQKYCLMGMISLHFNMILNMHACFLQG